MNFNKLIDNALRMLSKADNGIILLNVSNEPVHPADAAFRGEMVTPYNAIDFISESFKQNGLQIRDKETRMKLMQLLLEFEKVEANKTRKSKLKQLMAENELMEFGKIL
ncbi:hypothetical protein SYJ56_07995 [Algoriphagus sp. D3-2-R+10]|uniref:hypothetical protein n=1 Tax=Algoriphagus aurantiacus TaxID=3103948 RepID=UPI002B36F549|nr:hypothetical protein [Algoriphagus sp. D3-2-R+10]MEB2775246.1 hypothetical protein [Algoriphagus sp. D3-2-R+10]